MKTRLAAFAGTVRRMVRLPVFMSRARYERILDRVIECRAIYDRHAGSDYHHGGATAKVALTELGHICHVENELWADVQQRKANARPHAEARSDGSVLADVGGMVTCRGCAGQFDDGECPRPNIDKRSCWHASKHPANVPVEARRTETP